MRTILLCVLLPLVITSCSSVHTQKPRASLAALQASERFQLRVRTGSPVMDRLVYELTFQQFGDVLPLQEQEPFTGGMEVTFASSDQSAFMGSSTTMGNATAYGSGWYSHSGYIGSTATVTASSSTFSSGGAFTWQNSTMIIVLKRNDGQRLWSADYKYKGGWELSGWSVNTPEEAARLVVKRLRSKFDRDFKNG